jgi:hypothetical protein
MDYKQDDDGYDVEYGPENGHPVHIDIIKPPYIDVVPVKGGIEIIDKRPPLPSLFKWSLVLTASILVGTVIGNLIVWAIQSATRL